MINFGATGFDYHLEGGTIGTEYKLGPNFRVGSAFNFANPTLNLKGNSGHVDMDSYQLAGYSSLVYPNWFADAVVILGRNSYRRLAYGAGVSVAMFGWL